MKKTLVFLLTLLLLPSVVVAASNSFKIIDNSVYEKVMESSKVSERDMKLYGKIFAALKAGDMDKVEKLEERLKDDFLLGHVQAEKYLHKKYKSTYEQLTNWLKKYSNLPQYSRIKYLSVIKAPGYKPAKPIVAPKRIHASYSWFTDKYENLKPKERKYVKAKTEEFLLAVRKSNHEQAEKVLSDAKLKKVMPHKNYDAMSATLAAAYFLEDDNQSAIKWSRQAIKRSNDATASWFGGLASWRKEDYKKAAEYFGKLGKQKDNDEWLIAAGAFWAYRANGKLEQPEKAEEYLKIAANYRRTFHGILAQYILSQNVEYDWEPKSYFNKLDDKAYINDLQSSPAIKRALLLLKIGQNDLAESDLRYNYPKMDSKQRELLLYISHQYSLANLSFILASNLKNHNKGREYDMFLYPHPQWQPNDGWKVNQAWVWALIRQESLFASVVKSPAGACGLMQVMPGTAAQVTGDKSFKQDWRPLFDRSTNLTIGQNYVDYLRSCDYVGDNLIFLAASYNGGPSSLKKWVENIDYDNDPLLFMEMIPWRETRIYVKRVITNYWMYSSRFGQVPQSLQQFVDGKWPLLDEVE